MTQFDIFYNNIDLMGFFYELRYLLCIYTVFSSE